MDQHLVGDDLLCAGQSGMIIAQAPFNKWGCIVCFLSVQIRAHVKPRAFGFQLGG
jgi:hypothetical protein